MSRMRNTAEPSVERGQVLCDHVGRVLEGCQRDLAPKCY
jgi:hypothetical protein